MLNIDRFSRRPGSAAAFLGAAAIVSLQVAGIRPATADPVADPRTPINVNAEERAYILENMRTHLADVVGVVDGLAAGDSARALSAAKNLGSKASKGNTKRPAGMLAKFPKDFLDAVKSFHQEFDVVADGMENGDTGMQSMKRMAGAMQTCISCHASYKLELSAK